MKINKKLSLILSLGIFFSAGIGIKANAQPWCQASYSVPGVGIPLVGAKTGTTKSAYFSLEDGKAAIGVNSDSDAEGSYIIYYINQWSPDTKVDNWGTIGGDYVKNYSVISGHGYYLNMTNWAAFTTLSGHAYAGNPV